MENNWDDNENIDVIFNLIAIHHRACRLEEEKLANLLEQAIDEALDAFNVDLSQKGGAISSGGFYVGKG